MLYNYFEFCVLLSLSAIAFSATAIVLVGSFIVLASLYEDVKRRFFG